MSMDSNNKIIIDQRTEDRTIIDRYYSVQFPLSGEQCVFQFKLWDISSKGLCILVRENSIVMNHLKVGDVINMKYYPTEMIGPAEYLKTQIMHISKDAQGRFKGHFLVGLSILE